MDKPADFDWVTERVKCSTYSAFKELERLAKANTEKREASLTERDRQMVSFRFESSSQWFSVIAENLTRQVEFRLRGDQIEIDGDGIKVNLRVTLTLNNEGDCRLRVNGEGENQPWQVLRLALEDLFFDIRSRREREGV